MLRRDLRRRLKNEDGRCHDRAGVAVVVVSS